MNLQQRIDILVECGKYIESNGEAWMEAKEKATENNAWFIPEFVDLSLQNIKEAFLDRSKLSNWTNTYSLPGENKNPKNVGVVMAGNIPLVGFQDFLCVFVSGHIQTIKLSVKDKVLLEHLVKKMIEMNEDVARLVRFAPMLHGCDAYIATGSNNSARYFDYYFSKYPHIIRRNRTSVGILDGTETKSDLDLLSNDVNQYFGLGCRNVTKIFVPEKYDFLPLLDTCRKYSFLSDNHKYKHNYDYNLSMHIINRDFYMTNGSLILAENPSIFSPISQLNYEYYKNKEEIFSGLAMNDIQCIVANDNTPFGTAQSPALSDYADGVDTMKFLMELGN